jgi:hypothetical protein
MNSPKPKEKVRYDINSPNIYTNNTTNNNNNNSIIGQIELKQENKFTSRSGFIFTLCIIAFISALSFTAHNLFSLKSFSSSRLFDITFENNKFINTTTITNNNNIKSLNNYHDYINYNDTVNIIYVNDPPLQINDIKGKLLLFPMPKIIHQSLISTSTTERILSIDNNINIIINNNDDNKDNLNIAKDKMKRFLNNVNSRQYKANTNNIYKATTIDIEIGQNLIVEPTKCNYNKLRRRVNKDQYDNEINEIFQKFGSSNSDEEYIIELDNCNNDNIDLLNVEYKIIIKAISIKGLTNSLSTLSQLLSSPVGVTLPIIISDYPAYSWRGMLIDVSRHFIPVKLLKRTIDAMENSKMNRLHLHLTDSQSFPLLLDDVDGIELSQLAIKGSFSLDKIYTKANLIELVKYANDRGITIIPEIDVPAHVKSWGGAFKDIIVNCTITASKAQTPHNIYPVDPSNPLTMKVINGVLKQISEIFTTSKYLHIGGDEVDLPCWGESDRIREFSKNNDISLTQIFLNFEKEVFDMVRKLNKIPIVWEGVIDSNAVPVEANTSISNMDSNSVNKSVHKVEPSIIQPWKCWSGLAVRAATKAVATGKY